MGLAEEEFRLDRDGPCCDLGGVKFSRGKP